MTEKEKDFELFGYPTKGTKCACCESLDTKAEPRFGYSVCIKHFRVPPIEINNKT